MYDLIFIKEAALAAIDLMTLEQPGGKDYRRAQAVFRQAAEACRLLENMKEGKNDKENLS